MRDVFDRSVPVSARWFRRELPVGELRAQADGLAGRMRTYAQLPGRVAARMWRGLNAQRDAVLARIAEVEAYNAKVVLKRAMLADPVWRARVLAELGGMAALTRWERAWAKLCLRVGRARGDEAQEEEVRAEANDAVADVEGREGRRARLARTDESGQFRLMALSRGHYARGDFDKDRERSDSRGAPDQQSSPRTCEPKTRLKAIPVFADELRGEGEELAQRRLGPDEVGRELDAEFAVVVAGFVANATDTDELTLDDEAKPP